MTVLQRLLEAELVEIDDDAQMEKLTAAAGVIEKQLGEGKLALAPATLVAMDPLVEPDEPVLDAVYAAVVDQWSTVKRRHPDRPVTILRAVLAQALAAAGASDNAAAVIWATARSYAPYAPLAREQEVWTTVLAEIGERAERAASLTWAGRRNASGLEIPLPDLPALAASVKKVDPEQLKRHLAAAAGPTTDPPNGIVGNSNPVGERYNSGTSSPAWANTFGATAANGIALAVNNALQGIAQGINVTPFVAALGTYSEGIANAVSTALEPLQAIELRSRTLLWRTALYSHSQQKPYRDLAPQLVVLAAAADLAAEVPPVSPASIDNLVWEAAYAVLGDETTTVAEFVSALTGVSGLAALLGSEPAAPGRKTLVEFFRSVAATRDTPSDIRAQTGVEPEAEIRMADLARWLFRDLRAERIVAVPARVRRGRK